MRRVSVVGTSGVGKSTFASSLARVLGVSFLELDSVYHQADWAPLPASEFRARVAAAAAGECWVIDGNYSTVRDIAWAWQTHTRNRARYEAAMADPLYAHLRFVRLRSVRGFLRSAAEEPVADPGGR